MATSYLSRTPASAGNRQIFTFSFWTKISNVTSRMATYNFGNSTGTVGSGDGNIFFNQGSDQSLVVSCGGGVDMNVVTNQRFRDTSAWYHVVIAFDTTQATASNRVKVYINGTQVTSFSAATYPSQNYNLNVTNTSIQRLGTGYDGGITYYYDGSMASFYLIDGQQLTPSSFGETDATTGIWKPKGYSGSYGTNGFFLKFESSGSLGLDSSGNGNNFTVNGTPTQTVDTPSNNFATFNAVDKSDGTATTFSNGNLNVKHANGANGAVTAQRSTLAISKGKWYWEAKCISTGGDVRLGIISMSSTDYVTAANPYILNECYTYKQNGVKGTSSGDTAYGATYTAGDIISILYDADNGSLTFYKNGTTQGVAFSGLSTSFTWGAFSTEYDGGEYAYNFGNGFFTTTAITSPVSDGAGLGKFQYTVPTGYYALCTKNINVYG
jgi:hypothetical protein